LRETLSVRKRLGTIFWALPALGGIQVPHMHRGADAKIVLLRLVSALKICEGAVDDVAYQGGGRGAGGFSMPSHRPPTW